MDSREFKDPVLEELGYPATHEEGDPEGGTGGCRKGCLVGCLGMGVVGVVLAVALVFAAQRFMTGAFLSPNPLVQPSAEALPPERKAELEAKLKRFSADLEGPGGSTTIELSTDEINDAVRMFLAASPEAKRSARREEIPSVEITLPAPRAFDIKATVPAASGTGTTRIYLNLQLRGEVAVHDSVWKLILKEARIGNFRVPAWLREGLTQNFDPRSLNKQFPPGQADYQVVNLDIDGSGRVRAEVKTLTPGQGSGGRPGGDPAEETGQEPGADAADDEVEARPAPSPSPLLEQPSHSI